MKLIELKIKRKSLAIEAAYIRKEERKVLRKARLDNAIDNHGEPEAFIKKMREYGYDPVQIGRIWAGYYRSNRRTSAAENYNKYHSLHEHRINKVRKAARYAHVAHAFLKEKPYASVEASAREDIDPVRLLKEITSFGGEAELQGVVDWLS